MDNRFIIQEDSKKSKRFLLFLLPDPYILFFVRIRIIICCISICPKSRCRGEGRRRKEEETAFMLYGMLRGIMSGQGVNLSAMIAQILACLFVIFLILPFHEFAHGWMAKQLGDPTAKYAGRLTFNPLASLDFMGALFLLLFGFGWAKPVPVDPRYFKKPKRDMALTALAGPVANVIASYVGAVLYYLLLVVTRGALPMFFVYFLNAYVTVNISVAVFNLIPLPPLDGSRIIGAFMSDRALQMYYRYQNVIMMVLFLLLLTGVLNVPLNVIEQLLTNGISFLARLPFMPFGFF